MNFKIKDIIKSDLAISPEDGDIVFKLIVKKFERNESIHLDFSELDLITTAFLNNAIGNLYTKFSGETLNKLLKLENLEKADLFLIKEVIKVVKQKLDDSQVEEVLKKELGE